MFIDKLLLLDDGKSLTAGTTVSTDKIDLGDITPNRQVGDGEPLALVICVDTAYAGSTDTNTFNVLTDADAALGSPTILAARTIPKALLVAGARFVIPIPPGGPFERYLGASYVVGSGDTGVITTFIQPLSMVVKLKDYAKGYVNS
jgi:hypothetical protein